MLITKYHSSLFVLDRNKQLNTINSVMLHVACKCCQHQIYYDKQHAKHTCHQNNNIQSNNIHAITNCLPKTHSNLNVLNACQPQYAVKKIDTLY